MSPEELHHLYTEAIRTMPPFEKTENFQHLSREQVAWQAKTLALLEIQNNLADVIEFKSAIDRSGMPVARPAAALTFFRLLTTAVTRTELKMPPGARGAFVPLGDQFDALRAITDVMQAAERDLLIVDPYADDSVLLRYARTANEGVRIRILRDAKYQEIGDRLQTAKQAWAAQFGDSRPLEIRSAPSKTLHDRFIAQDSVRIFLISQSLKDIALRSPATIQKADDGITTEKIEAYEAMWQAAQVL